jgi:hypothetical protein
MESYPTTGAGAYEALDYVPSVAQWARCEALKIVSARYAPGMMPPRAEAWRVIEPLVLRWAKLIETGEISELKASDHG